MKVESYIRTICKAALSSSPPPPPPAQQGNGSDVGGATTENVSMNDQVGVKIHVTRGVGYNEWAPMERARLVALCAALKKAYEDSVQSAAALTARINSAAASMKTEKARIDELKKIIETKEEEQRGLGKKVEKFVERKNFIRTIKSQIDKKNKLENVFKNNPKKAGQKVLLKLQKDLTKLAERIYEGGTDNMPESPTWESLLDKCISDVKRQKELWKKKADSGNGQFQKVQDYTNLSAEIFDIEKQINHIQQNEMKELRKTIKDCKNDLLHLSGGDEDVGNGLLKQYGISPEVGIFVENVLSNLFPNNSMDPVDTRGRMLVELMENQQLPQIFNERLQLADLESCVLHFYDVRLATLRELERTLQGDLEKVCFHFSVCFCAL